MTLAWQPSARSIALNSTTASAALIMSVDALASKSVVSSGSPFVTPLVAAFRRQATGVPEALIELAEFSVRTPLEILVAA